MPQVTIYLDAETDAKLRRAAEAAGLSYSKWVAKLIEERTRSEWPRSVSDLAGAWAEEDGLSPVDGEDLPREQF